MNNNELKEIPKTDAEVIIELGQKLKIKNNEILYWMNEANKTSEKYEKEWKQEFDEIIKIVGSHGCLNDHIKDILNYIKLNDKIIELMMNEYYFEEDKSYYKEKWKQQALKELK